MNAIRPGSTKITNRRGRAKLLLSLGSWVWRTRKLGGSLALPCRWHIFHPQRARTFIVAGVILINLFNFGLHAATPIQKYWDFASHHDGDVALGKKIFEDVRTGCVKCHSTDGHGARVGPDLFAVGDKLPRRELIRAVLEPSASIAIGYGTAIVETKSGETYTGIIQDETPEAIDLVQADGKHIRIALSDIHTRRGSNLSLMPEGLQAGLTVQEFTSLIQYLSTLRQPENSLASNLGMPENIPLLAQPITLQPFLEQEIRYPADFVSTPGEVRNGLVWFTQIPGTTNIFLAVHETGPIVRIEKTGSNTLVTPFLNLSREIFNERGPNGLDCLVFDPHFRKNHKYYLEHQIFEDGKIETAVLERTMATDFRTDSGQPSRLIWKTVATTQDHTGGGIAFGPDGYLYIGMGDTGPQGDPEGHGQNLNVQLGKMLRIDVHHQDPGLGYAIPRDNPFVKRTDVCPEIWAYGLREPWRFSFDSVTGDLWVGDVGQDRVEEVDIVQRGKNYGWNVYEGFEPYSNHYRKPGEQYAPPVFAYRRKFGASAIGGYVYRGDKKSSFYGVYIFADYVSHRIFGVKQKDGKLVSVQQIGTVPQAPASLAQDENKELYIVGYSGMIYHLDLTHARFDSDSQSNSR